MQKEPVEVLSEKLSVYDAVDLLATVGALQLVPENADRAIRLEAFAHAVAALPERSGKPPIGRQQLARFCNTRPLGNGWIPEAEDPCANLFTQGIPFHGGSFVVFPGSAPESIFILRHLMYTLIEEHDPLLHAEFVREAQDLLTGMLALSTAIASRAGLDRGVVPVSAENKAKVVIPEKGHLDKLKHAVRFSREEFVALLRAAGIDAAALQELTHPLGHVTLANYKVRHGELLTHPLIQTNDQIIVALPGALIAATNHALIDRAVRWGASEALAAHYNQAVWRTVAEALSYLEVREDASPLAPLPAVRCLRDRVARFDTDKLLYVLLVTDPLTAFDNGAVFGTWPPEDLSDLVIKRLADIEQHLFSLTDAPNEVLALVLIQGAGRWPNIMVHRSADAPSLFLCMSAADLQTIALLERGDPLSLWKYARAHWQLYDSMPVVAPSVLDEFSVYLSGGHCYLLPASVLFEPHIIVLPTDEEGELNRRALLQEDWHAVSFSQSYAVEVMRLYEKPNVPLYRLHGLWGEPMAVVVEGLPLPIWATVAFGEDGKPEPLAAFESAFAAGILPAIVYWLWQFTPSLGPYLEPLATMYRTLRIEVTPPSQESWQQEAEEGASSKELLIELVRDMESGILRLIMPSAVRRIFEQRDNEGERMIMLAVLYGVREFLPEPQHSDLTDDIIRAIVDDSAPIGIKKMMLVSDLQSVPDQDSRDLSPYRIVQEADVNTLRREMLLSMSQVAFEPHTAKDWNELYDHVVEWFYRLFERVISTLSSDNLLEWLIRYHETITYEAAHAHASLLPRLECFSSVPDMVAELVRMTPDASMAAVASRFLIEYVVAQPPHGLRPISLDVYDHLLALAALITEFGFESDLIHLRLVVPAETEGGFEAARERFMDARDSFRVAFASGQIARARQELEDYWTQKQLGAYPDAIATKVEVATQAEFGLPLTKIATLLGNIGQIGDAFEPSLVCLPVEELVDRLETEFSWSREEVQQMLHHFTLEPRDRFLGLPPGESAYPWQFNRAFSFARRPFVQRERGGQPEVLWGQRHLYRAGQNLFDLLFSGRYKAKTPELRALMGEIGHLHGEMFNDTVADQLKEQPNLRVKRRVEKVGALKIRGPHGKLGDIDILVAHLSRQCLYVIECKDLGLARTPREIANEMEAFFDGKHGEKSTIERHLLRVEWVQNHLQDVVTWLTGQPYDREWTLESLIVVDDVLFGPYVRRSPVRVVPVENLIQVLSF